MLFNNVTYKAPTPFKIVFRMLMIIILQILGWIVLRKTGVISDIKFMKAQFEAGIKRMAGMAIFGDILITSNT